MPPMVVQSHRPPPRRPDTYAHSHMPPRDFSPYSNRSVRLKLPLSSIPDPTSSSSLDDDVHVDVDVGRWTRDVQLSIRTAVSPPLSIIGTNEDIPTASADPLDNDDFQRLNSTRTDIDSTPRANRRIPQPRGLPRQPSNTPHIEINSPASNHSDEETVRGSSVPVVNPRPSQPTTDRLITPAFDTGNTGKRNAIEAAALSGWTYPNNNHPTTNSNANHKRSDLSTYVHPGWGFVAGQTQPSHTAPRILGFNTTTRQYIYTNEPVSQYPLSLQQQQYYQQAQQQYYQDAQQQYYRQAHQQYSYYQQAHQQYYPYQYQAHNPTYHLQYPPQPTYWNPTVGAIPQPHGWQTYIPSGPHYQVPSGLPPGFRPGQLVDNPTQPVNHPSRVQSIPPNGIPRFQAIPRSEIPSSGYYCPDPCVPKDAPPPVPPKPKETPVTIPADTKIKASGALPRYIRDYYRGKIDIHTHDLDRFIPMAMDEPTPMEELMPIEIPSLTFSPAPSEPVEPTSPGAPSKTIYMIRVGEGRDLLSEARARVIHLLSCQNIPIQILGFDPSLSRRGRSQVKDLCKRTLSNIQAKAQLLVTSPQCRALETTSALFPLCRRLFPLCRRLFPLCRRLTRRNMTQEASPIKVLASLRDTRPDPNVPFDVAKELIPSPRSKLYFKLEFDDTKVVTDLSILKHNLEDAKETLDWQDPLTGVRERAKAMREWLWDREEMVIVVVSHNDFMHHLVDFGDRHTKWDHGQIREFTMFNSVEGYGPSMVEVGLDLSGPPRKAPKSLIERIEERKLMCHVE